MSVLLKWHSRNDSKKEKSHDNAEDPFPLPTWPGQQLEKTVEEIVSQEDIDINCECISELGRKVELELQSLYPFEKKEQYDFCMLSSESDIVEAEILTRSLSKQFELVGHLVWNSVHAGNDQFTVFEDIIERSSVVIFYITQNLLDDQFCCHIMRNRMVNPIGNDGTIRDIPLLIDKNVVLPEPLILIQKLTLDYIEMQFPKIFTNTIRMEKLERQVKYEMQVNEMRVSVLKYVIKRVSINMK
ncbi:hypothetical protein L9F63_008224 [Diploptera punctata]|uniref:TIR domain-containing protein n=1 Tax=Diploptera punctata TaxID=6984 RepID=A0AAD7Z6C0_DIPPU|nr:hypothetical protein L9F63_008224 [Diploptera punctata]